MKMLTCMSVNDDQSSFPRRAPLAKGFLRFVSLLASLTFVVPANATARLPYPFLASAKGVRIYGPPAQPGRGTCPRAAKLPNASLRQVRRLVAVAMPAFEARLHLNGHDARVRASFATASGFGPTAGGCGAQVWQRSVVAFVHLPHISGASRSEHTFAVAKIRQGWVLWAWIH